MKYPASLLCLLLTLVLLSACSLPPAAQPSPTPPPAQEMTEEAVQEQESAGLPNPIRESSAEDIEALFGLSMRAPSGAEEISYSIIQTETPIAQLRFSLDGADYCFRAARAFPYEDISGMYSDWELVSVEEGEDGSIRLIPGGAGVYDRFDRESGTIYCLALNSGASAEALESMARLLWGEGQKDTPQMEELLRALHESYFPGTAGSSLSAAARAAELADFFAAGLVEPDDVFKAVNAYGVQLPAEEKDLFDLQLNGVVAMFGTLTAEGGERILQDCGYSPSHYPWSEGKVRDCFIALLGSD